MKRQISALLLVLFTLALQAQTNLSGRIYHHPDIMAEGMKAYRDHGAGELGQAALDGGQLAA